MTLSRDTTIEALVIGGTAGLFAAGVNIAARYTHDAGAILGFIGSALGAGAAVVGTLWLERHRKRSDERERRIALARLLIGLSARAVHVLTGPDAQRRSAMQALRTTIGTFVRRRDAQVLDDPEADALLDTFTERAEIAQAALAGAETRIARGEQAPAEAVAAVAFDLELLVKATAAVFRYGTEWPVEARTEAERLAAPFRPPEP